MTDFAVPQHRLALARRLDHIAFQIKTGQGSDHHLAEALRDYADMVERKI